MPLEMAFSSVEKSEHEPNCTLWGLVGIVVSWVGDVPKDDKNDACSDAQMTFYVLLVVSCWQPIIVLLVATASSILLMIACFCFVFVPEDKVLEIEKLK